MRAATWMKSIALGAISLLVVGCQCAAPPALAHRAAPVVTPAAKVLPATKQEALNVQWAVPKDWKALPMQKTPLYVHQQFRSPTLCTGFGVAYVHMPLPLSAKAVVWFAKGEYTKKSNEGRLIGEWTDKLGRYWFEAENAKYHVKGYAVTKGFDAWIVYSGYRMTRDRQPEEIQLATEVADAIVPLPLLVKDAPKTATASAN